MREVIIYNISSIINKVIEFIISTDCSERTDVYIGLSAFLTALIIFIAEYVKDAKTDIEKNFIVFCTNINDNVTLMIFTLAFLWIRKFTIFSNFCIYLYLQLAIDILIVICFYKTLKMFLILFELWIKPDYKEKMFLNYIKTQLFQYENNQSYYKNSIKNATEEIRKLSNIKTYSSDTNVKELYPLKTNVSGLIININLSKLYQLDEEINNIKLVNDNGENQLNNNVDEFTKYDKFKQTIIYINPNIIGKKVNPGDIIGYTNKDYYGHKYYDYYFDYDLSNDMVKEKNYINKVFEMVFKDNINSANVKYLVALYDEIITKKYENSKTDFKNLFYDYFRQKINNVDCLNALCDLVYSILDKGYKINDIKEIEYFEGILETLFEKRLDLEENSKKVVYEYVVNVYRYDNYFSSDYIDLNKYDISMKNLLKFINKIYSDNIDALDIIAENITFRNKTITINDLKNDDIYIYNFQFAVGLFYFDICKNEKQNTKKNNNNRMNLITLAKKLISFECLEDLIDYYFNYIDKSTLIQNYIHFSNLKYENYEYKRIATYDVPNMDYTLKYFIKYITINNWYISNEYINKLIPEDIRKFNIMKDVLSYDLGDDNDTKIAIVGNSIEKCISKCMEKEEERKINGEIDQIKINKFHDDLIEKLTFNSTLMKQLNVKKVYKEQKQEIAIGITKLLPREWFIKDIEINNDYLIDSFVRSFINRFDKDIFASICEKASVKDIKLNDYLEQLNDIDDYIILTNYRFAYDHDIKHKNNVYEFNDKKIPIIFSYDIDNLILANINHMPTLSLYNSSDKFEEKYIEKHDDIKYYYQLLECKNNEKMKADLIKESTWLFEKGDENAQKEYLDKLIYFRILVFAKIDNDTIEDCSMFKEI